jgi:hypothetical protein
VACFVRDKLINVAVLEGAAGESELFRVSVDKNGAINEHAGVTSMARRLAT